MKGLDAVMHWLGFTTVRNAAAIITPALERIDVADARAEVVRSKIEAKLNRTKDPQALITARLDPAKKDPDADR